MHLYAQRAPELKLQCRYSHSIVAGGLLEMSYTTRFTPRTSLIIRLLISARILNGIRAQSAVMKSWLSTARIAITESYDRASPITPTVPIGSNTANTCAVLR